MKRTFLTSLFLLGFFSLYGQPGNEPIDFDKARALYQRQLDKLVWERADFGNDGVHPSDSGRQKVAELLLNFLATDPLAKPWFLTR